MSPVADESANQATEIVAGLIASAYSNDRAGVETFADPALIRRDSRRLGGPTVVGLDDFWTAARGILDVGFNRWTSSAVELRGDSLAVVRVEQFTDAGEAMEWIVVVRSGGDGRIAELVYLDPEDVSSSIAELDRLYSQPT